VVPAVDVEIMAGDQMPLIEGVLVELLGNVPGVAPTQYGPKVVNVGVILALTTTVIVVEFAHVLQPVGVKV
jgi:transcription antitermination factor NusG